jgi:hypothetical protein
LAIFVFEGGTSMRKSTESTQLGVRTNWISLRRAGGTLVLLAGVALGPSAMLAPSIALAEGDDAHAKADAESQESLLVASRARTSPQITQPVTEKTGPTIEPIASSSNPQPDPEDLEKLETDAQEFGAALAEMASQRAGHASEKSPPRDLVDVDCKKVAAEPAKFNGVQPGTSTRSDLVVAWGDPDDVAVTGDSEVLSYNTKPFRSVEVLLTANVVDAIKIELADTIPAADLAKQLTIDKIEAVEVADEQGKLLGQVFPERGVLFMCAPSDEQAPKSPDASLQISHVVIQPLDANAFALRAENRLHGPYEKNIRDLRFALVLDPEFAHARWLLADIYLANGQGDLAEAEAAKAMNLDPNNSAYQLRWARALALLGRYDEAAQETRKVLDRESTPPVVKAEALHEMSCLAAKGDAEIAAKAIPFDNEAIGIADKLATSDNVKERRAAKEVLIEAHLNIAQEIAGQQYNNKLPSISEWISRASGLAEDYIQTDGGNLEWRLRVAQQSLAALASFKHDREPAPWVAEAQQAADELMKQSDDQLWQQKIQWEVGVAYLYAAQIEHMRAKTASALRYGQLAIENLAEGAKSRQATPECEQLVGQLYYCIGAIHAIHNVDHQKAVLWYDRAAPLLTSPKPVSELLAPRRDGEELVSMGVSYWQTGQRDRGLELTKAGTALVEQAVEDKILAKSALAVPYGNLAAMFQELGQKTDATKYAALAKSAGNTKPMARNVAASPRTRPNQSQSAGNAQYRTRNTAASPSSLKKPAMAASAPSQPMRTQVMASKQQPQAKPAADMSTAAKTSNHEASRPSPHDPRTVPSADAGLR